MGLELAIFGTSALLVRRLTNVAKVGSPISLIPGSLLWLPDPTILYAKDRARDWDI